MLYLVARRTAGLERFRMVPAAVEPPVAVKVDQVDEQFPANGARKAAGVPDVIRSGPRRHHGHVAAAQPFGALHQANVSQSVQATLFLDASHLTATDRRRIGDGQLAHGAAAECLALPLSREQAQLFLLVFGQRRTVAHLVVVRRKLVEQLPDAVLFADRVHVRHLVLGQHGKVQVHLNDEKTKK